MRWAFNVFFSFGCDTLTNYLPLSRIFSVMRGIPGVIEFSVFFLLKAFFTFSVLVQKSDLKKKLFSADCARRSQMLSAREKHKTRYARLAIEFRLHECEWKQEIGAVCVCVEKVAEWNFALSSLFMLSGGLTNVASICVKCHEKLM